MEVGHIMITYDLEEDGDLTTTVLIKGKIHLATQLGLLELAKESILLGNVEKKEEE